jgi:hypothetical protein
LRVLSLIDKAIINWKKERQTMVRILLTLRKMCILFLCRPAVSWAHTYIPWGPNSQMGQTLQLWGPLLSLNMYPFLWIFSLCSSFISRLVPLNLLPQVISPLLCIYIVDFLSSLIFMWWFSHAFFLPIRTMLCDHWWNPSIFA